MQERFQELPILVVTWLTDAQTFNFMKKGMKRVGLLVESGKTVDF